MYNSSNAELTEKRWDPTKSYKKVEESINNEWPDWKKKAYNEIFATSAHAKKLSVTK